MWWGHAVNAARKWAESFGTYLKCFVDWHLAFFGFQFVGLVPPGWACPPLNSVVVPLLASCSLSCVIWHFSNAGLYWCYGINLEDSTDIIWFGILIALQLASFYFLTDFWPFLSYAWSYNKLLVSLQATLVIQLPCWMKNRGAAPQEKSRLSNCSCSS